MDHVPTGVYQCSFGPQRDRSHGVCPRHQANLDAPSSIWSNVRARNCYCNHHEASYMTAKLTLEEKFNATGGKGAYVQHLFGRIAGIYDPMNRLMSFGLDSRWRRFAARYLALNTGELGLDLGTGTADLSIEVIRNSGRGTHMIGMDITPEMLEVGRRKIARLGLEDRIELRTGDAEHI